MNKHLRNTVEAAVMLALLICLQAAGSLVPDPMTKQLLTGTMVNCVLAVTVLLVGLGGGIAVALVSPLCAFLLGIAPNLITVLPIMVGNCCYVVLLRLILCKGRCPLWRKGLGLAAASVVKFGVLYALVVQLAGGLFYGQLAGKKLHTWMLMPPNAEKHAMLMLMFSWPQLVTALAGGILALSILPVLRKAKK